MIYENENNADGIIKILKKLHKFVPCDKNTLFNKEEAIEHQLPSEDGQKEPVFGHQGIVGDQLSVERGISGHMSLSNGFTKEERLEGLHFEIADWHAGNKFLEVCISCGAALVILGESAWKNSVHWLGMTQCCPTCSLKKKWTIGTS